MSARVTPTAANAWPRWRGARFDGTATTGGRTFSGPFELRVRWKKSIGAGYSGVVVAEGHAVTMTSDGKTDFLISLSSDSGKENWRVPLAAAFPGRDGSTGGPVSTPAIDAGVAYGLGPFGELVAVQLSTGKELWRRQIAKELEAVAPHWGFTTSPLVTGEIVIVLTGGSPDKAVTAFNKRTGATVWRSGSDSVDFGPKSGPAPHRWNQPALRFLRVHTGRPHCLPVREKSWAEFPGPEESAASPGLESCGIKFAAAAAAGRPRSAGQGCQPARAHRGA